MCKPPIIKAKQKTIDVFSTLFPILQGLWWTNWTISDIPMVDLRFPSIPKDASVFTFFPLKHIGDEKLRRCTPFCVQKALFYFCRTVGYLYRSRSLMFWPLWPESCFCRTRELGDTCTVPAYSVHTSLPYKFANYSMCNIFSCFRISLTWCHKSTLANSKASDLAFAERAKCFVPLHIRS